jgi:hypothetical protein
MALALLPGLAMLATAVQGQSPAEAPAPKKVYTQKTNFKLPIRIDDRDRGNIQEVRLYVKMGANGQWQPTAIPPSQSAFNYQAPQDGEYWFSVTTVDRLGRQTPVDVNSEPPKLIVIVDTKPPELVVRKMTAVSGDVYLQCEVQDANLDPSKTKMEYLAKDQTWKTLEVLPEQPGIFRMPDRDQCQGPVRASAGDRANNWNHCELNVFTAETASSAVPAADALRQASTVENRPAPSPTASQSEKPMLPPAQDADVSRTASAPGEMSHQLINSTHATLAYQIDQAGPEGVGRVEVWITRDKGQNWKFLCEDPDRHSPVEIDLPGDGLYGLSLVVGSGPSMAPTPPAPGETPDWWVEVDTSKPVAQITGVHLDNGALVITWTATDNCLKAEPIDLYYSVRPDGPWLPIARSLRNDGSYRWAIPAGLPPAIYVRMEVTDRAGNVGECQTSQPVARESMRPKAHVIGLAAGDKRITAPHAH